MRPTLDLSMRLGAIQQLDKKELEESTKKDVPKSSAGSDSDEEMDAKVCSRALPNAGCDVAALAQSTGCRYCGSTKDAKSLLLCDCCDLEFHLKCLRPPLKQVLDNARHRTQNFLLLLPDSERHLVLRLLQAELKEL